MRLAIPLVLSALSLNASAQQLLKPQNIRFDGTQEYTPAELQSFVAVKKGSVYTTEYLGQTAQKLMSLGVFDKVAFKFDGVDLVYQLHDNPDLYVVAVGNLPLEPGPQLEDAIKQRVPLFHGKVPSEGAMLDNVRASLEAMLAEQGLDAKVSYVPAGDAYKKATSIQFRVESPPIKVGEFRLTGASETMQTAIAKAAKFNDADFDAVLSPNEVGERIRAAYIRYGYPSAQVQVRPAKAAIANGVIRVPLLVNVLEGRSYRLGAVRVAEGLPVDAAPLQKLAQTRDKFVPEGALVDAYVAYVDHALRSKGYLDCKVTPVPALDEASGTASYTVTATTGAQYHLGLMKFENVSDQLRSMLMRNWQLMPGDPFDENYVADFMFAAQKSDPILQRTLAGIKTRYDIRADPNTHEVNLVIRLER